jgi:hypothetical protein
MGKSWKTFKFKVLFIFWHIPSSNL